MYIPAHFTENDSQALLQFIDLYSFGLLVTSRDSTPYATHLPFLVTKEDDNVVLLGHVARANPHWQFLSENNSMAVFQGPHAYISPTWYESEGQVPTWNYVAVHAYGKAEILDNADHLREIVYELSDKFERNRDDPWIPDFDENMLNAIVGFRMPIQKLEGKSKLSQNKTELDRKGAIKQLETNGSEDETAIAALMAATLVQNQVE